MIFLPTKHTGFLTTEYLNSAAALNSKPQVVYTCIVYSCYMQSIAGAIQNYFTSPERWGSTLAEEKRNTEAAIQLEIQVSVFRKFKYSNSIRIDKGLCQSPSKCLISVVLVAPVFAKSRVLS